MLLSTYERADSPWVHVQFRAHPRQKKQIKKTVIRKDDPHKKRLLAPILKAFRKSLREEKKEIEADDPTGETWVWVDAYLHLRYGKTSRTAEVYRFQWLQLQKFLEQCEILSPAHLRREHCAPGYVNWRTSQIKEKSKKNPSVNTAIGELKLLAMIMDEAMGRGIVDANPCRKLRIHRAEPKVKPEFTNEHVAAIYEALKTRPPWMQRSFHIGLQTGLRFRETRILRSQVQLAESPPQLQIEKPKGGAGKAFSIPIYPPIRAMIEEFWCSGDPELWSLSPAELDFASMEWRKFFNSLGLREHCFHCTRVTFITCGARAGIPRDAMMAMVNHASADIHRIYQRFRGADVLKYVEQMRLPAPPAAAATG